MKKKKFAPETCPICDNLYGKYRLKTRHHIFFPSRWFENSLVVYACSQCHQKEFHKLYRMDYYNPWTRAECLANWIKFCKSKGKNAFVIYPELITLISL